VTLKNRHVSTSALITTIAALLVVAAHVALIGVLSRAQLSLVFLAGASVLVVLKYAWWKHRR
jgi:amino acid transporter